MARDMSWEEAILIVLRDSDGSMRCAEIAEQVSLRALRKSVGATPAATIAAILSKSINDENSPFVRIGRGEYVLKSVEGDPVEATEASQVEGSAAYVQDETSETGALRAFGMYWKRDQVVWKGRPKLFGRQGLGSTKVDFAGQVGVYLLHDRGRVICVGRANDALVLRLMSHTTDRLSGRWDRFSWFGLRSVDDDGQLSDSSHYWSQFSVVETLEALLIESLEPPLNRRRGDNLSGVEYLQVNDPEIERMQRKRIIERMSQSIDDSDFG